MSTVKSKLEEMKRYIGQDDAESRKGFEDTLKWLKENATSEEDRAAVKKFIDDGIAAEIADLRRIRDQIAGNYKLLPMSYIAKNYFGKSAAWLAQRVNGTPVRGKVYTLNAEQKETFNNAVQDIARRIGSVKIA